MSQRIIITIFFSILFLAGCQKPDPISLTSPDNGQQSSVEVVTPGTTVAPLVSTSNIDSSKYFPTLESKSFGNLIIEGSQYDSPTEHHEAAAAIAVFYNRTSPVVINRDTLFNTLDPGTITVDQLALRSMTQVHSFHERPDTAFGTQYLLYAEDNVGGKGFSFDGGREYEWKSAGSIQLPSFDLTIATPEEIHIVSPDVRTTIRLSSNLVVRWTGGADTIRILIRAMEGDTPGKLWFQLRLNKNNGRVIIPEAVLALLPHDHSEFMFSFTSSNTSRVPLNGFSGDVLIQTVTTHNLVLHVKP